MRPRHKETLKITANLPTDRSYLGTLIVGENEYEVSGQTVPGLASPDPQPGLYRLERTVLTPRNDEARIRLYGPAILFFVNAAGLPLPVHGGEAGADGLTMTTGGLRLSDANLEELIGAIDGKEVVLEIEEKHLGFLERVGRTQVVPLVVPQRAPAPKRSSAVDDDSITDNPFFWMWLFSNSDSPSAETAASDSEINPGGGTFGGGGTDDTGDAPQPVQQNDEQEGLPLIVDPFPAAAAAAVAESAVTTPQVEDQPAAAPEPASAPASYEPDPAPSESPGTSY